MKKFLTLCVLIAGLSACKNQTKNTEDTSTQKKAENLEIQQQIAQANGLEEFKDVQEIKFTFNVKSGDSIRTSRNWIWNPQSHKIRLTEGDISRTYTKDGDLTEEEKEMDQKFINDSYWLLFPFQLVWSDADISEEKDATAPISKEKMDKVVVSYPQQGGYTPGDTYEIFYGDDLLVREWIYKSAKGNGQMATTWEDYEDFDGIKIAKSHKSGDGNFEIFFSDVEVD